MKRLADFIQKHFIASQILLCLSGGIVISVIATVVNMIDGLTSPYYHGSVVEIILGELANGIGLIFLYAVAVLPFAVTIFEIIYLVIAAMGNGKTKISVKKYAIYDCFAFIAGVILEAFLLSLDDVMFGAQWYEELVNAQLHAPINPDYAVTFAVLSILFIVGMLIISLSSPQERPPLVSVLSIAMMYIGVIEAVLFTIHVMGMHYTGSDGEVHICFDFMLLFALFIPFNMILILVRTMLIQIKLYEPDENRMSKIDSIPFLSKCNRILCNSKNWPIAAVVAMIPILGVVIAILALFGQAPDAAIKAFTETANYTFSTKIPPQNVFHDEHYLCTVAAGGHEKIVKPIRMGKRHGHDVVVNRQLMIANAFEQVLEERTPRFHRVVRNFYDKYGFPIAKLIKSKTVADIVWFVMKPLEWIFLITLYLVDANPEDRIAKQYL